jgi:hypothetical protein
MFKIKFNWRKFWVLPALALLALGGAYSYCEFGADYFNFPADLDELLLWAQWFGVILCALFVLFVIFDIKRFFYDVKYFLYMLFGRFDLVALLEHKKKLHKLRRRPRNVNTKGIWETTKKR